MNRCLILAFLLAAPLYAGQAITWKRLQLNDKFYAEGANLGDINKDGKTDVISGPFWYEGPDWQKKHAYYAPKEFSINGYSDNFFCYARDFNGDGWDDILVLGFPGKEARLYLSPGTFSADTPWNVHIVADVVDNESPVFTDITGDGKPEIVCCTGGKFGWFAPNWEKPTEKWPFVAVSEDMKVAKFTHGLGVGDVNKDGKLDLLEARRWWENGGSTTFTQHNFAAGVGGGAQMFAYDFDGDGKNDVATALAAHRYGVAVFMNRAGNEGPQWERRTLVGGQPWENDYGIVFSQPHAMHLADIDGDGIQDLVTGKRYWAHNGHDPDERGARVVYWFQTKRLPGGKVEFVPHLIDANSGVGVDVQVGDLNGDKLPDVVVGNKAGVFVLLQERHEISAEAAKQLEPKKMYGPGLQPQKEYKGGQSAQDALKGLQLPGGFKAELIAAEPDVVQPIAMCWDERGRLWVVEGMSYPKPREPGAGQDRILILEDKDGDGTFETRKVFAEGISLASGIEVGFGGVWVGASPYLVFIADKDRDDKPDAVEVPNPVPGLAFKGQILLDGWGSQDTHETLNSFIWGPDGWLYGCHGVFTHSLVGKPGTAEEQRTPINAGVWRYHPVRHQFEVFAHGTSNPWGLDYDQNGEFFVTACVIPHLYHIVPGGRYFRQGGQHFNPYTYDDIKTIADHAHFAGNIRDNAHWGGRDAGAVVADDTNQAGGGHAHCGLAIYQSAQFPATYRNQFIFGNLHGHRLVTDYVDPHGSTFAGKHGSDFMRSNDMNFVPVTQKVGPDGALYVSDWSDKQVCHRGSNAVELWDRSNGRIYRISHGNAGSPSSYIFPTPQPDLFGTKATIEIKVPFDLTKEDNVVLFKLAIQTDNDWFSRMARRVMMERHAAEPAKELLTGGYLQAFGDYCLHEEVPSPMRQRAIWLGHQIGQWHDLMTLQILEESAQPNVKVRAIRFASEYLGQQRFDKFIAEDFVKLAAKEVSPVVRREYASLLQSLPATARAALGRALLTRAEDKEDPYIPLLIWYGIEPLVGADPKVGLELAKISKIEKVTQFIYRRLGAEESGRTALLGIVAESKDAAQRETLLHTVLESARSGNKITMPADWAALKAKLGDVAAVNELEAFMGIPEAKQIFRTQLTDTTLPAKKREAALILLLQVRDAATAPLLAELIRANDKALTRHAVQALGTLPHEGTPALLIEKFSNFDAGVKIDAVNTLATNAAGAKALLLAVKDKKVPNSMLSPFLARQMDTLKSQEVKALLKEVWGDLNAPKADLPQRKQKFRAILTKDALAKADVAKGRMIFSATCGTCHRLCGEGANVGPDLTGSNRMDLDYLLDNVLDPNAVIGKAYQLNVFELTDGRLTSGVIKEETPVAYHIAMPG
ncbi:MAG: PVC-type heme-binding CxxCH protein, partial [Prosthecobacter sp.]|nr:PVC-type heme-binding CxxCH protein [Prosthecobacter sp.]